MKLYKFRPLSNDADFKRLKEILTTGRFWCSQFTELNDPMEGAFSIHLTQNINMEIENVLSQKLSYKFCSFADKNGFKTPLLWDYYANGFKGVAVEIEVEDEIAKEWKIDYQPKIPTFGPEVTPQKILQTKLSIWVHENEYRFIKESAEDKHEIGKIINIYFGDPYKIFQNSDNVGQKSTSFKRYDCYRSILKNIANQNEIDCYLVTIIDKENPTIKSIKFKSDNEGMCADEMRVSNYAENSQSSLFKSTSEANLQERRKIRIDALKSNLLRQLQKEEADKKEIWNKLGVISVIELYANIDVASKQDFQEAVLQLEREKKLTFDKQTEINDFFESKVTSCPMPK